MGNFGDQHLKRVILQCFYGGYSGKTRTANLIYERECVLDSLKRGESPLVGHRIFPEVLDQADDREFALGLEASFAWIRMADLTVVYDDRGISRSMKWGVKMAKSIAQKIEYRKIRA